MTNAFRELQYALRRLRASPTFAVAATLTVAVAIGATASVFGLVDGVLLKAFPYRDTSRVVTIWESNPAMQAPKTLVAAPNFIDYRTQTDAFTEFAAASWPNEGTVTGRQEPERVTAVAVTPTYFSTLGLTPILGRGFEMDSAGPAEIVLGYDYWQRRFGGANSVLGQKLIVDAQPYTIVGVMPPGLPEETALWARLSFGADMLAHRDWHLQRVYGKLKSGVTPDQARQELNVVAARLAQTFPQTNQGWSVLTVPLLDQVVGDLRPALLMLLAAAGCVLLIGAANLANLFLVRYVARERELGIRTALGATRSRLLRELSTEAAALGAVAGALGVGLATVGVRILRSLAPPNLPRVEHIGVDGRVVAFCALASISTVLICGVLPAWQTSRSDLADIVKEGARGASSGRHRRMQDALAVLQVAVALVLLTGAGLMVDSFEHFRRADLGFRPDGVLTAKLAPPDTRYHTPEREAMFASSIVERLATQPGVLATSASSALPGAASMRWAFQIVGDPVPEPSREPTVRPVYVTTDYFKTMDIPLLRGRTLLPSDDRQTVKVAVIDDLLARRFFDGRDPIGRELTFRESLVSDTLTIVGVVGSVRQGGLVSDDVPVLYAPYAQVPVTFGDLAVAVRVPGDPSAETRTLERTVLQLDPTVPISDVKTMPMRVTLSVGTPRFSTFLASLFAAIAFVLGLVGIYSVLSYVVSQRRREIGIRLALGATRAHIMGDVFRRALALAGVGIALGSAAAWMLTRALTGLFPGVSAHDPTIFVGASVLFTLTVLVAACVPAFRTTRVSPVVVLASS